MVVEAMEEMEMEVVGKMATPSSRGAYAMIVEDGGRRLTPTTMPDGIKSREVPVLNLSGKAGIPVEEINRVARVKVPTRIQLANKRKLVEAVLWQVIGGTMTKLEGGRKLILPAMVGGAKNLQLETNIILRLLSPKAVLNLLQQAINLMAM